jgi:hypothetical protein
MGKGTKVHGLTPVRRDGALVGWNKRVNGKPKWIVSVSVAPTAEAADAYYQQRFAELWSESEPKAEPIADPMDAPVEELCDVFLTRKRTRVGQQVRGIEQATYDEYQGALQDFCDHAPEPGRTIGSTHYRDLSPNDFGSFHAALGRRFGVDRQKKYVIITRSLFKQLAQPPVRLPLPDYGDQFPLPSRKDLRRARKRHKEEHGPKLFEPSAVRAQLDGRPLTKEERTAEASRRKERRRGLTKEIPTRKKGAGPTMRAMILLGINAGFGNTDLAELPLSVTRGALANG